MTIWDEHPELVQLPLCPECGERVVANLCQTNAKDETTARAIEDLMLAVHRLQLHS